MLTNAVAMREYRAEGGHEFAVLNHLIISVTVLHVRISADVVPFLAIMLMLCVKLAFIQEHSHRE